MDEPPNFTIPATYDIVWPVVVVLVIVVLATSLISMAWFAIGRRSTSNENPDAVH